MSNILWFKPFKCEDELLFFVICDSKLEIFSFLVEQKKQIENIIVG